MGMPAQFGKAQMQDLSLQEMQCLSCSNLSFTFWEGSKKSIISLRIDLFTYTCKRLFLVLKRGLMSSYWTNSDLSIANLEFHMVLRSWCTACGSWLASSLCSRNVTVGFTSVMLLCTASSSPVMNDPLNVLQSTIFRVRATQLNLVYV